jgi:hypothetical protein
MRRPPSAGSSTAAAAGAFTRQNTGCGCGAGPAPGSPANARSASASQRRAGARPDRRQEGRIAGRGQQVRGGAAPQAGFQAGQRTGKARQYRPATPARQSAVGIQVLVGVDGHACHLRREALEHVRHHGRAAKRLQALVDAAHARAASACQDQAADRCCSFTIIPPM